MAQPSRVLQLIDQLPVDLTLSELRELETRLHRLLALKAKAEKQRQAELASLLQERYPGLRALLHSGRAQLGEAKTPALYAPTGASLRRKLTSQALLDQDRADR